MRLFSIFFGELNVGFVLKFQLEYLMQFYVSQSSEDEFNVMLSSKLGKSLYLCKVWSLPIIVVGS